MAGCTSKMKSTKKYAKGGMADKMGYKKGGAVAFKPCASCKTPAKCKKAGKCLAKAKK